MRQSGEGRVIVLNGTTSAGKSTLAKTLQRKLRRPGSRGS
jgi:chloramphenicol 3-O-phosphotransferase